MNEHVKDLQNLVVPIKATLKRIAFDPENFRKSNLDERPVEGSFIEFPRLGKTFVFGFNRMDGGWWRTTKVTYVSMYKGVIRFATKNSVYELKDRWEEEDKDATISNTTTRTR